MGIDKHDVGEVEHVSNTAKYGVVSESVVIYKRIFEIDKMHANIAHKIVGNAIRRVIPYTKLLIKITSRKKLLMSSLNFIK